MLRSSIKLGTSFCALFPIEYRSIFGADNVSQQTETEKKTDFSVVNQETGWDRVKRIFQKDEFGAISLELNMISQACCMSMFTGALYGGVMHSRTAYLDFLRNNQATCFKDHIDAKRQLHDAVTKSFAKGAFRWGWRLTMFTTTFITVATVMNTYRGKSGIIEYVTAGSLSGFLYKFKEGPRAWVVGGGLGAVLGTIAGGATLAILHLAGVSLEEAKYWQHHWYAERNIKLKKGMEDYLNQETKEIMDVHDKYVGELQTDVANVDKVSSNKNNS